MMLTLRAGKVAALATFLFLAAACSREQQDWRSAEAADTVESYGQFLARHPESELVTQARTRVAQLTEEREWQQTSQTDTADAYRQFLSQHPNGKWSQEARIRIQNFALNGLPPAGPPMATAQDAASGAAVAPPSAPPASAPAAASASAGATAIAAPNELAHAAASGELAQAAGSAQPQSAQASPGELAHAAGAQVATTTPAAAAPVSPPPPKYSAPYASTPASNLSSSNSPSTNAPAGYGVQLGAFGSASAATNEWQQLTARFGTQLSGLTAHVVTANTSTGTLFRLQAQVPDEAHARSLCDLLRKQSQPCVPVLPH